MNRTALFIVAALSCAALAHGLSWPHRVGQALDGVYFIGWQLMEIDGRDLQLRQYSNVRRTLDAFVAPSAGALVVDSPALSGRCPFEVKHGRLLLKGSPECPERLLPDPFRNSFMEDLGPIGLVPLRFPRDVFGVWEDEESGKRATLVTPAERPQRPGPLKTKAMLGPVLEVHAFDPDAHGISHENFDCGCIAGHIDFAADIYWFQISADRAVRYVTPGACHGSPLAKGVQTFRRVK